MLTSRSHNKADCPNPRVERAFTGTCNICSEEGHRAADCPQNVCKFCEKTGHKAIDCKTRKVDYGNAEDLEVEEAWNRLKRADEEKDMDEFRKASTSMYLGEPADTQQLFRSYAKASTASECDEFDLVELENLFRQQGWNAHLVAKKCDVSIDYTIVDFQGNADKTYVLDIQWSRKSRRAGLSSNLAESPEENLERLKDCGLIQDRGIPKCSQCGGKWTVPMKTCSR